MAWLDGGWRTIAEARVGLRELISDPNNAVRYGCNNWDNYLVGGQIREEDGRISIFAGVARH